MAVKIEQNFVVWTGNDLNLTFNVTDDNSSALDLTGAAVRWKTAWEPFETVILAKSSTIGTSSLEITNSTAGVVAVRLNETDTNSLRAGVYYHELEVQDSTGNPFTVATGHMTLNKSLI